MKLYAREGANGSRFVGGDRTEIVGRVDDPVRDGRGAFDLGARLHTPHGTHVFGAPVHSADPAYTTPLAADGDERVVVARVLIVPLQTGLHWTGAPEQLVVPVALYARSAVALCT